MEAVDKRLVGFERELKAIRGEVFPHSDRLTFLTSQGGALVMHGKVMASDQSLTLEATKALSLKVLNFERSIRTLSHLVRSSFDRLDAIEHLPVGMDISHGSPGRADVPSIAAVVSYRGWPSISCYRAALRIQSPKAEIIDGLFKLVPGTTNDDDGMVRELLLDFYYSSTKMKPKRIIVFGDGVSESQFSQVVNKELDKFKEACKFLEEDYCPNFTLIVAQKNHHTRFLLQSSPANVPPRTVIDSTVCHPRKNDFFMYAQAGMIVSIR
ncbi:protein argonaute 4A-like [Silene latifolia]|uniref:protein argonaute 4A-like n=1 Tax=Silene latifolia TaxID=37657 RepID=UPI003D76CB30